MKRTGIAAAVAGLLLGVTLAWRSWDGLVYFYDRGGAREPSAVPNAFDFSNLRGNAFELAGRNRLLSEASVLVQNDELQLNLGHFVMRGVSGQKTFACREFDRIELTFVSEGVAVNGEPATMTVEALCSPADDGARTLPISIPVAKILNQPAGNVELQFWDDNKTNLRFTNMPSEWPSQWVLRQARLFSTDDTGRELLVDRAEIRRILAQTLQMNWSGFHAKRAPGEDQ